MCRKVLGHPPRERRGLRGWACGHIQQTEGAERGLSDFWRPLRGLWLQALCTAPGLRNLSASCRVPHRPSEQERGIFQLLPAPGALSSRGSVIPAHRLV